MANENIVIIGTGIAAINAVKAIREHNQTVTIDLFGAEPFYPYNRMKLSKSLFDQLAEEQILLQKKEWYQLNKVNLQRETKVQKVDTLNQKVILDNGREVAYGKLLIATGASNRVPQVAGLNRANARTLRGLNDARAIHDAIAAKQSILHIGGGIQGLETAWILRQHHKQVIIAEIQPRLMPNQLDERSSLILKDAVEAAGVKVLLNTQITRIAGEGTMMEVEAGDGTKVTCDLVLYATGIGPNIEFLEGTPVRTGRGVMVDAQMRTNISNIYAAGDVAEFEGKIFGLWNIAVGQGKTAGYNLVHVPATYQPVAPVTTLNAFGISLFSMGNVDENSATRTLDGSEQQGNTYKRIFIKDNMIIGAIVIGDTSKSPLLKSAIEQRLALDRLDRAVATVEELFEQLKNLKK